jgi:hypothetical protein
VMLRITIRVGISWKTLLDQAHRTEPVSVRVASHKIMSD